MEQPSSTESCPTTGTAVSDERKYLPYQKAIALLSLRLSATPPELAAWVYLGPEFGGLSAYETPTAVAITGFVMQGVPMSAF